jgi:putative endonuclease
VVRELELGTVVPTNERVTFYVALFLLKIMHYCYVIYSHTLDRYYIGESNNVEHRLELHNSGYYQGAYTKMATDWVVFIIIPCSNRSTALMVERFIKQKKSSKFIRQLKDNPEYFKLFYHCKTIQIKI